MADTPLWTPSAERIAASNLTAFIELVNGRHGLSLRDYPGLHAWSIANLEGFWAALWDYGGVIGDKGGRVLADADKMPGARFFPDGKLNYAENLLRTRSGDGKPVDDDADAIVFWGENKVR